MNTAVAAAAENNHQVAAVTEKELIVRTNGREFSVGFAKAQFCYIYCTFSSDLSTERTPFAFFFVRPRIHHDYLSTCHVQKPIYLWQVLGKMRFELTKKKQGTKRVSLATHPWAV
jgi:hypothetical protein